MYDNIIISGIGIYHPDNAVDNQFFIDHFDKLGIDVRESLVAAGRDKRYLSTKKDETIISMGTNATLEALSDAGIGAEELDAVIFATDSPEYSCPSNAVMLNAEVGANNANYTFDFNTNCTGMLYAMDVAHKMMRGDKRLNKVLIAGSLLASLIASEMDPVIYSNFADSAAAIVLERVNEDKPRGFVDSTCITDTFVKDGYKMPNKGYSQIYDNSIDIQDKKFKLDPFDASFVPVVWSKLINQVLDRNDHSIGDVSHFLFSQFSKALSDSTLDMFGLPHEMHTFVGDRYGYTGVTSPFMAYYHALKDKTIQTDDTVIFCSVGAGFNSIAILYQL